MHPRGRVPRRRPRHPRGVPVTPIRRRRDEQDARGGQRRKAEAPPRRSHLGHGDAARRSSALRGPRRSRWSYSRRTTYNTPLHTCTPVRNCSYT